jgi:hypothetical protein
VSDWFFMLGEPLEPEEVGQVRAYLRALGLEHDVPVEAVREWFAAAALIKDLSWDRCWWDAEQLEAKRLYSSAAGARGEHELLRTLSARLERAHAELHGAAAVQAARAGYADASLIRAAAGAASHALYLAELAELCGAGYAHPFLLKRSLFASGHWPLGVVSGCYYVF